MNPIETIIIKPRKNPLTIAAWYLRILPRKIDCKFFHRAGSTIHKVEANKPFKCLARDVTFADPLATRHYVMIRLYNITRSANADMGRRQKEGGPRQKP